MVLSSLRVMPVCLACTEWEYVHDYYRTLNDKKIRPALA